MTITPANLRKMADLNANHLEAEVCDVLRQAADEIERLRQRLQIEEDANAAYRRLGELL
jgi:hypothetical protein